MMHVLFQKLLTSSAFSGICGCDIPLMNFWILESLRLLLMHFEVFLSNLLKKGPEFKNL